MSAGRCGLVPAVTLTHIDLHSHVGPSSIHRCCDREPAILRCAGGLTAWLRKRHWVAEGLCSASFAIGRL